MTKQNAALKNLKRNLYRQAINYQAGGTFIQDKGVYTYMALWHFFANPTDENAVYYVVCDLENEIKKLEQKDLPKDRWPKFLQKEDWKEQTYLKFCVPYPGKVHEIVEVTPQSTKDYKYVADKVKESLRNDNLEFAHHKAVAPLPEYRTKGYCNGLVKGRRCCAKDSK